MVSTSAYSGIAQTSIVHKIFLSPHLDDAVLSCGGIISMASSNGERVLIVTICAELPPREVKSPFVDEMHRVTGFADGVAYVTARRNEDRAAAAILGAQIEWSRSMDAIYRRPKDYDCVKMLMGLPVLNDPLIDEAAQVIADLRRRFPQASFYAPLGVGGHVDHRVVSSAAQTADAEVFFYEEFPYIVHSRTRIQANVSKVVDIGIHVNQRIAATLCYRSQIPLLFSNEAVARAAIARYVTLRGGERLWRR